MKRDAEGWMLLDFECRWKKGFSQRLDLPLYLSGAGASIFLFRQKALAFSSLNRVTE